MENVPQFLNSSIPVAPIAPPRAHDAVAQRLEMAFRQLREGKITRKDYLCELRDEENASKVRRSKLRAERSTMDPIHFEQAMEDVEDDREQIRWRLQWLEVQG